MTFFKAISQDLYEAAALDGANGWQKFVNITIPQLNSTIVVNVLMSLTGAFASNFDIVNILTGGADPRHWCRTHLAPSESRRTSRSPDKR